MLLYAGGDGIALALHIVTFFVCRAAGVEGWWLLAAPIGITIVLWILAFLQYLKESEDAVDACVLSGILAIVFPGAELQVILYDSRYDPPDLIGSTDWSQMLSVSLLPIVAFYACLFIPFPEGTTAVQSVLWAFVVLGLQLTPLACHVLTPDNPLYYQVIEARHRG